jgi:multimeric flavodoxin WrbA
VNDTLTALTINCTLKSAPASSSTDVLLDQIEDELDKLGVSSTRVRIVDERVAFGVSADEGDGDGWPAILDKLLAADIFVFATPIWMGHPASVAQVVMERLDAFLGDTDDRGQMRSVDRVALVGVVGNEDGAHHVGAEVFQGLSDTGFTLPPNGMTYWVGEAMHGTDYKDLPDTPAKTAQTTHTMVVNGVHLARLLKQHPFPDL